MYHKLINEDDDHDATTNTTTTNYESFEFKNRSTKESRSRQSSRNGSNSPSYVDPNRYDVIEHNIQPNDTLQDFYVLKVIRIPVIKHGFLTDSTNGDQQQQQQQDDQRTYFVDDLVDVTQEPSKTLSTKTKVINIGISKYLTNDDDNNENYKKFLNNLCQDLEEIRKFNQSKSEENIMATDDNNSNDDDDHITIVSVKSTKTSAHCDGSDLGIHWKYLIMIIIFICLLVPLYILYNLENHHH
nr:uncharacterized protein LOC124493387 isoform X2 [Dermatophagoides farinae]